VFTVTVGLGFHRCTDKGHIFTDKG